MKYHTVTHIHAYLSNKFAKIISRQPDVTSHIILLQEKMSMSVNYNDQRNDRYIPVAPCHSSMVYLFT